MPRVQVCVDFPGPGRNEGMLQWGAYFVLGEHFSIKELTADLLITLLANMGRGDPNGDAHFRGSTGKKTYGTSMNIWRVSQHKQPRGICRDSCVPGWATTHSMM